MICNVIGWDRKSLSHKSLSSSDAIFGNLLHCITHYRETTSDPACHNTMNSLTRTVVIRVIIIIIIVVRYI